MTCPFPPTAFGEVRWCVKGPYRTLQQHVSHGNWEEWRDVGEEKMDPGMEAMNPSGRFWAVSSPGMGILGVFLHEGNARVWAAKTVSVFTLIEVHLDHEQVKGWLRKNGKTFNYMGFETVT